jgi:hypothetical protein
MKMAIRGMRHQQCSSIGQQVCGDNGFYYYLPGVMKAIISAKYLLGAWFGSLASF